MKPTNEQLLELMQIQNQHAFEVESFLHVLAQNQATLFKFMATRISNLTASERELLKDAASRSESSLDRAETMTKQLRSSFEELLGNL